MKKLANMKMKLKKMEQDRSDLVTAIVKLKDSINELNQKGRERLIEAFEKVNRKFNEVYTKLFNGGNAKLELVDSDDPLEAGLEMLVSPQVKGFNHNITFGWRTSANCFIINFCSFF
jgi:chromosome segregation protein